MKKILLILFFVSLSGTSCSSTKFYRNMKKTVAPFDGSKFDNIEPFDDKSLTKLIKWRYKSMDHSVDWPESRKNKIFKPKSQRSQSLQISVINHATVLIQIDGINILTDPIYSDRTSPFQWIGPKRVIQPGIKFEDLPPIDIILISHNHYDHLDLTTLKRLSDKFSPLIFAGLGTRSFLEDNMIKNAKDFDWWEKTKFKNLEISFVPSQHWSARGINDKREVLWGGFWVKGSKSIYFAGDTGYGKFFKMINEKLGAPDLGLLPIGAYEPRWFMKNAHMNPDDTVKAFIDLKVKKAVGIHFGTFKLTDEGIDQPIIDLKKALKKYQVSSTDFRVPVFGETYSY